MGQCVEGRAFVHSARAAETVTARGAASRRCFVRRPDLVRCLDGEQAADLTV